MGFLFGFKPGTRKRDPLKGVSPEFMAQAGCSICPLQHKPKALNEGPRNAPVFIIGEAPGATEAEQERPFVGPSGELLRSALPRGWERRVRFGNVIQSYPGDREPDAVEMACCRGFLDDDIADVKPRAIIGLGNVPLAALTGQSRVTHFDGRRFPVEIAGHRTWYHALVHPAYVLRADASKRDDIRRLFRLHIRNVFDSLDSLPEPVIHTPAMAREQIVVSRDVGQIVKFLEEATCLQAVGFDYETDRLRPYGGGTILTVAVATPAASLAFPLGHREANYSVAGKATVVDALIKLLESPVVKCVHNAAFELEWTMAQLSREAVRPGGWGCSLAQAYLLDGRPRTHSLDFLCKLHFGLNLKDLSPLEVTQLAETDYYDVCHYNALDAKYHLKLYDIQRQQIEAGGLQSIYDHHMARIVALVRGQNIGLPVDIEVNTALTRSYQERLDAVSATLAKLPEVQQFREVTKAGKVIPFNVSSSKHVKAIIEKSGGRVIENTDEATLSKLKGKFPKAVLAHRSIGKILGTYLTNMPALVQEGRLHPIISANHTRTWRTSSEGPNIQNFPKRDADTKEVRKQIVAPPGHWLVSVDYSSIQARAVAMESRDKKLVQAFRDRYDIHADWSERIQRLIPNWAGGRDEKSLRHLAKNKFVFPSLFGAQPGTVAYYLEVDEGHGHELQDAFWRAFPDIHTWHADLRRSYQKHLYVTGLSGFRRHAPISQNELINSPIQGDEALLVCEALVRLSQYEDDALQPVMLIHDDLSFFVPKQRWDECMDTILREMLKIEHDWINVPMAVEVSAGNDWYDQKPIGQFESIQDGYIEVSKEDRR